MTPIDAGRLGWIQHQIKYSSYKSEVERILAADAEWLRKHPPSMTLEQSEQVERMAWNLTKGKCNRHDIFYFCRDIILGTCYSTTNQEQEISVTEKEASMPEKPKMVGMPMPSIGRITQCAKVLLQTTGPISHADRAILLLLSDDEYRRDHPETPATPTPSPDEDREPELPLGMTCDRDGNYVDPPTDNCVAHHWFVSACTPTMLEMVIKHKRWRERQSQRAQAELVTDEMVKAAMHLHIPPHFTIHQTMAARIAAALKCQKERK